MLVGNGDDAAALEITFAGPAMEVTEEAVVAVTGADLPVALNGRRVPQWVAHRAHPGDRITCGQVERGVRAYFCISGGIAIPPLLGSRSTYLLARFGGVEGRRLQAGDLLPVGPVRPETDSLVGRTIPSGFLPRLGREIELRIIMGLCSYRLTEDSLEKFLGARWEVSSEADRVGYRLKGPAFRFKDREPPFGAGSDASNVVDVGYPVGSVQVPGGQEAILLMRDAVTGGGYATIGTVIQCDLDLLAQAPPGAKVMFRAVDVDDAMRARREYRTRISAIARYLSLFERVGLLGP
jgi:biotin-dependent carboxylase-like uncharacterized protein